MIPFVNLTDVCAKATMLFVRQDEVEDQKNLLQHQAGNL
jgi:hypothetical protein